MLRTSLLLGVLTLLGASTAFADGGYAQNATGHWEQRGYEWVWVADVQQPCAEDQQAYGYDTNYNANYGATYDYNYNNNYASAYVSYPQYVVPQVRIYRPAPVIRIQPRWGWYRAPRIERVRWDNHWRWGNHRGHDRGRRWR